MIEPYLDKNGFVCSRKISGFDEIGRPVSPTNPWFDGGDSANRTFAYYIGQYYQGKRLNFIKMNKQLNLLEHPDSAGNYRRHPDSLFWYSERNRMSRDQSIPVLVAMGLFGFTKHLKTMFKAHLKRGLLFTTNTRRNGTTKENHGQQYHSNAKPLRWYHKLILKFKIPILPVPKGYRNYNWKLPDLTGPEYWAAYIRAFKFKKLYFLLPILDIEGLANAYLKTKIKDDDVINHCILSVYSNNEQPTFVSKLTNKINSSKKLGASLQRFYEEPEVASDLANVWEEVISNNFEGE